MSAPATEQAPLEEQPTQPLTIPQPRPTERSWLMSEASEALIPATILTAVAVGILLRNLVFVTAVEQSNFAITVLAAAYILTLLALVVPRVLNSDAAVRFRHRES